MKKSLDGKIFELVCYKYLSSCINLLLFSLKIGSVKTFHETLSRNKVKRISSSLCINPPSRRGLYARQGFAYWCTILTIHWLEFYNLGSQEDEYPTQD